MEQGYKGINKVGVLINKENQPDHGRLVLLSRRKKLKKLISDYIISNISAKTRA